MEDDTYLLEKPLVCKPEVSGNEGFPVTCRATHERKSTPQDLLRLETIFTYNRNRDRISVILEQVETYERLVKEQAEKIEQVKLEGNN